MTKHYDFSAVEKQFVHKAANYTGARYRNWQVEASDVAQEIYVWLYAEANTAKVQRWLAASPQQTTRVYRSMLDVALKYAEKQKANNLGYAVDDVYWYTPGAVEGLMPLVVDPTYVESDGAISECITMVLDIRRVMSRSDIAFFTLNDSSNPNYADEIQNVINKLGGQRPFRRTMSNARAQALNGAGYTG